MVPPRNTFHLTQKTSLGSISCNHIHLALCLSSPTFFHWINYDGVQNKPYTYMCVCPCVCVNAGILFEQMFQMNTGSQNAWCLPWQHDVLNNWRFVLRDVLLSFSLAATLWERMGYLTVYTTDFVWSRKDLQTEGVWGEVADGNIWSKEEASNKWKENICKWAASCALRLMLFEWAHNIF